MKMKNKNATIIYANRFISLIAEYGYTILINIYLSRISVRDVFLGGEATSQPSRS